MMASIARAASKAFLRHTTSPVLGSVRHSALPSITAAASFMPTTIASQSTLSASSPFSSILSSSSLQVRSLSSVAEEYWKNKKALKELRTKRFAERQEHKEVVKKRRQERPKNTRKKRFNFWFKEKKRHEEFHQRRARRLNLDWKIQCAVVLERLPKIVPDRPDWEREYYNLRSYLDQWGRYMPDSFLGKHEILELEELTDEAMMEKYLPRGYTPAPRETAADHSGEVRTLDRRLKTWVYLTVKDSVGDGPLRWQFPTVAVKEEESLLEASKRAIVEKVGSGMDIYYPSGCPMAVDLEVYTKEERAKHGNVAGVKTFFMVVQHDEFDVKADNIFVEDYAWLERTEVVDRVMEEQGERQSKLYEYLLKQED